MIIPKIIKREYKSGFKAEVILKPHFYQRFFGIIIDFGSSAPQKVAGSAHFLEHKLFESEDGDAFRLFAETGADANAYTSFDKTCYLFSCTENFGASLKALLTFVQSPYFTRETVEKEQEIIAQEIKMYDDSPSWRVMFGLLEALYENKAVKTDIAGTVESIRQITPELLYRCYDTFYNLSNMVLSIAGNFDPEEAKKIIGENLKPSKPISFSRYRYNEPLLAVSKRFEKEMDVSQPLFQFGFKIPPEETPEGSLRQEIELELLLELMVGSASDYYERLYEKGLLNGTFGAEVYGGRGYIAALCGGESKDPDYVYQEFLSLVQQLKEKGICEEDFLSCKNSMYGRFIKGLNDAESIASDLLNYEMTGSGLFDAVDLLASITPAQLQRRLETSFIDGASAISVILPRKG